MSKVDLFIPTYNRPVFLRRILTYYNNYGVKYRIIIADSSDNLNKKLNKKIVAGFSDLNILYVDRFSPKQTSHQKFGEMVKLARAKYTVFCADDDFLIPSGVEEGVKFLEKNKDYVSAHGTYISFYIYKTKFFTRFLWHFIYPYRTISENTPYRRLEKHLGNYYQVLWSVRRTEIVKRAYKEFLKFKVSPVLFGEITPDILTLIFGKMKRLNCLYSARQAFSTSYSYWPTLQDAIKDGTYEFEYSKFRRTLINSVNNLSKDKIKAVNVDQVMKKYLKHSNQEHLVYQANRLLSKIPSIFSSIVRQSHMLYLFNKPNNDTIGFIDNPKSKYYSDFEKLKKIVLNFS